MGIRSQQAIVRSEFGQTEFWEKICPDRFGPAVDVTTNWREAVERRMVITEGDTNLSQVTGTLHLS